MKKCLALAISAMCFAPAGALRAVEPWQKLQNPTASQVAATWQSPPPEYGPEPYYGLNGPVTVEQVERDLDTMKRLGFEAVTVQAGYNMPFAYLSPEYFAFFRTFVDEAKKRNMRVWIVDDAGYPSGFAGGGSLRWRRICACRDSRWRSRFRWQEGRRCTRRWARMW